ncbi:VOC family protein [Aestuariibacter sp. A3R04]|uniref:VOC family protein n=1 Tax=Aestuariibacter sp. A3R04 TaxID=2841571 RepID=UPI001C096368|nr:VOC family protein [Aestuariibacter sp. A3R04]MBU3023966.1 VOC family protein [Aestuariibacter sp. A3R04]
MTSNTKRHIGSIAFLVKNYDEAVTYFTECLSFSLLCDIDKGEDSRWIQVAPTAEGGVSLVLVKATTAEQRALVGNQTGGPVLLFLHTADFWGDYEKMKSRGVVFHETPREEIYGTVAVFEDLYGNKWDLIQPTN